MKKILKFTIGLFLFSSLTFGQVIKIHTQNGTDSHNLADIDSITFDVSGSNSSSLKDIDGNVYQTVQIGDQVWMAENLKVTHYRNGDPIPYDNYPTTTGAYCNYKNDTTYVPTYGRLYNWYAVNDSRNIAPEGWHVATDDDWKQLEMYLGMSQEDADSTGWRESNEVGGKLKEAGTEHWADPNTAATNESGFTALPGGWRTDFNSDFATMGQYCFFWMPDEIDDGSAWTRRVAWVNPGVYRFHEDKMSAFSIRCIKD
ncbi:SclB protein [hydrothermal vent metagenome]|uniref:SclB protein n=1 Tax=hydrothermal vent metagenome TaxID=652676 RepID=A0A3B1C8R1_9ZZZZ